MEGRRIFLFATRDDLIELFETADPGARWKYVDGSPLWREQRPRQTWESLGQVRSLGESRGGKFDRPQIIVMNRRTKPRERTWLVHGKRRRWGIDFNPRWALMHPPGVFEQERVVMGGTISTLRATPAAERIVRDLRNALRRMKWARTNLFWFGPYAAELARRGWRCTEDVQSPANYDVAPPKA